MSAIQTWVIDADQIVHTPSCVGITPRSTPYVVKIPNDGSMAEHLLRPETANGHSAPSRVRACKLCVNAMIDEQTIS